MDTTVPAKHSNGIARTAFVLAGGDEASRRRIAEILTGAGALRVENTGKPPHEDAGEDCVILYLYREPLSQEERQCLSYSELPVIALMDKDAVPPANPHEATLFADWMPLPLHPPFLELCLLRAREYKRLQALEKSYPNQYDSLTDLPNRHEFMTRMQAVYGQGERPVLLLRLTLGRYEAVVHALGRDEGEKLLRAFARRLADFAGRNDLLGCFGGNAFALTMAADTKTALHDRLAALRRLLAEPLEVEGFGKITSPVAIGLAEVSFPMNAEETLRDADHALYEARRRGPAHLEIADRTLRNMAVHSFHMEDALHGAADRGELRLAFQPSVRLKDQRLSGFEILTRWLPQDERYDHESNGRPGPEQFIALAEESGQMVALGDWVLRTAIAQLSSWQKRFGRTPAVSINLSPLQLANRKFLPRLERLLADHGIPGDALTLEITEGLLLDQDILDSGILTRLRDMGMRISIDDFGKGYSALSYLYRLPADELKIDREFVTPLMENERCGKVAEGIIALARKLNLTIVAEGIEKRDQFERLRACGCDRGQGFFWSQPLEGETATALIGEMNDTEHPEEIWKKLRADMADV